MIIEFAQFGPDRSNFDPAYCDTLTNVLPQANSWGPFPGYSAFTQALPARPQGAFLATVSNGNYILFAGTANGLFTLNAGTLAFDDRSKLGGYTTPDSQRWSFVQFGDWVVAANGVDPIQFIDISGALGTFADLSADAPIPRFIGVLGDFLMTLNLTTGDKTIQWSGLNKPQFWLPRDNSSDFQVFPDGGEILGYSGFERGCVIFHEHVIREGSLALDTALVMTFKKTVENHGCTSPKSVVTTGNGIFYLSQDGFYRYGVPPVPIGNERVDGFFLDDIAQEELYDVYGSEDPTRKIVYWAYRSKANNTPRSYDRVLCYHYGVDRWSMLEPGVYLTGLIEAATPGYTLDGLDALGISLDDLSFSLDSRAWSGGAPALAAFDVDNKMGFFSGSPLEAVLQTGDSQLADGRRSVVTGWRPIVDAEGMTGRVAVKDRAGQMPQWKQPATANTTGLIPARASGRYHRFELTVPEGIDWNHAHGIEPEGRPEGRA